MNKKERCWESRDELYKSSPHAVLGSLLDLLVPAWTPLWWRSVHNKPSKVVEKRKG